MDTQTPATFRTDPTAVHATLKATMLIDGFDVVLDLDRSNGPWLVDAKSGDAYLDLFSFFASLPVSYNNPGMRLPAYLHRLHTAAAWKPTNSDLYTEAMADFVSTFSRILPPGFQHLFFVEGGALAVENTLKAAFDWKVKKNIAKGRADTLGSQVLHFKDAFHGRSGYTLSLTNTFDPRKTQYFPKFQWPRVPTPGLKFPVTPEETARVAAGEQQSLQAIKEVLAKNPHDIAAIIIETIQGEGGDVQFRSEFFRALREICDAEEIMLIFDEVQAGMGITGKWWAFEHYGVSPDLFSFGK
jgi:L-lysine 6-transaminase